VSFLVASSNHYQSPLLPPTISSWLFPVISIFSCCSFQPVSIPLAFLQASIPSSFLQPVSIPAASPNHYYSLLPLPAIITCFFLQSLAFPLAWSSRHHFQYLSSNESV
jgi:hypothetical protein